MRGRRMRYVTCHLFTEVLLKHNIASKTRAGQCTMPLTAANVRNTKGYRASGAGAVVCGRHSLVRPTAVGDLQKGEKSVSIVL